MAKLCRGCKGPLCPYCDGCINEGECMCIWEIPIAGLGEEELDRRVANRESAAADLLEVCEAINGKIDQGMIDYWGPNAIHNIPLSVQEIETLRAAIAKAKGQ